MPQVAAPTWGAIGFVAIRALELLLRDPPVPHGVAVACPAPAPAAAGDWRLEVCEARLDAARSCPVRVEAPTPQEDASARILHGGAATAAGSVLTVLVQLIFWIARRCCSRREAADEQDARHPGPQVHHPLQRRRRLAGIVV
jgi:hypothetical protein